jgi:hypothetical protein
LSAAAIIERNLFRGADPVFGGPLSAAEARLWEHILVGVHRRRRTWREWLAQGLLFFKGTPFGPSSGGAGGSLNAAELGGAGRSFGNSYPWLFPTADFRNFDKYGTVALGAVNAQTSIGGTVAGQAITYNDASDLPWFVPPGYNGFIKAMALDFVANGGTPWVQGELPPGLSFGLMVDRKAAEDYGTFFFSPGVVTAPTPLAGVPIKENNLVQLFVTNLALGAPSTQFVEARLQGYYYGKDLEPKELAF